MSEAPWSWDNAMARIDALEEAEKARDPHFRPGDVRVNDAEVREPEKKGERHSHRPLVLVKGHRRGQVWALGYIDGMVSRLRGAAKIAGLAGSDGQVTYSLTETDVAVLMSALLAYGALVRGAAAIKVMVPEIKQRVAADRDSEVE